MSDECRLYQWYSMHVSVHEWVMQPFIITCGIAKKLEMSEDVKEAKILAQSEDDDGLDVIAVRAPSVLIKTPFIKTVRKPKSSSLGNLRLKLKRLEAGSERGKRGLSKEEILEKEADQKWADVLSKTSGHKNRDSAAHLKQVIKQKERRKHKKKVNAIHKVKARLKPDPQHLKNDKSKIRHAANVKPKGKRKIE